MQHALDECTGFEWDNANREKSLRKHGITMEESESVFSNTPLLMLDDVLHSETERRYIAYGKTAASKLLTVSFTIRHRRIHIISARPMSAKERKIYAKSDQSIQ